MRKRKKWTAAEKIAILEEAKQHGVVQTIRKHEVSHASFYVWQQKYQIEGEKAFEKEYKRVDPELKRLQLENLRLKKIIAEKELALDIKEELLKKTTFQYMERK
mgnify:CR=1 FL=1